MKHAMKITLILIVIFFISQLVGLSIVNKDIEVQTLDNGTITIQHSSESYVPPPPAEKSNSYIWLIVAILVGTGLVFILMYFKILFMWKLWFFLSVWVTLTAALGVLMNIWHAALLSFIVAIFKIFRPNIYVHNLTEPLVYTGLAVIFVQWMNVFSALMLLLLISVYDMIAVWKSKHMIKLAKFQSETNAFAGLFIPYGKPEKKAKASKKAGKTKKVAVENAVLARGDIGFPLIFAAAIMEDLIVNKGISKLAALGDVLLISLGASIALFLLFVFAKEDRFYPAMPFITAGCLAGYGILLLLI